MGTKRMHKIEYLKERLEEVELLLKEINLEDLEDFGVQKFDVRVVLETKPFNEWEWRRTILSKHELTLEQRNKLIGNLRWLRNV